MLICTLRTARKYVVMQTSSSLIYMCQYDELNCQIPLRSVYLVKSQAFAHVEEDK